MRIGIRRILQCYTLLVGRSSTTNSLYQTHRVHNMCYIFRDAANAGERPRLYNFLLQLPITVHSVNCYNGHPGASWFASSQKSESSLDCINVKPVHRITSSLGELDARSLMLGVSGSSQAKTGSIKTQNLMHENQKFSSKKFLGLRKDRGSKEAYFCS